MPNFTYPTTIEMQQVSEDLQAQLTLDDMIFRHFGVVNVESDMMRWEQRDNYLGMQQVRGINGQPGVVQAIGSKTYQYQPGYYGEVRPIDEAEITRRAQLAMVSPRPISIDDLVLDANRYLLHREIVLIKYILWTLVTTGTFAIAKNGVPIHTDSFDIQTAAAAVDWDTVATSTPLADFRTVQRLEEGHGVKFGAGATMVMNRVTWGKMMNSTNTVDIAGKLARTLSLGTNNGVELADLALVNKILAGADLPSIEINNDGYLSDAGVFTKFVADDKVVFFGQRQAGEPLGEYRKTINANNTPVGPGSYVKVVDSDTPGNPNPVPRKIDVHRGHNGGPVIYYPSGVVVLSV